MTDVAEHLLREVLAEDAARAPLPGDLASPARSRLRRRRFRTAGLVTAVAVAAGLTTVVALPEGRQRAGLVAPPPAEELTLVGPTWNLVSYGIDNVVANVPENTLSLHVGSDGTFRVDACNAVSGPAVVTRTRVTFLVHVTTDVACRPPAFDRVFMEVVRQPVVWKVEGTTLRLQANGGDTLTFRQHVPQYPHEYAQQLDVGARDGWNYRVSADADTLHIAARERPDLPWTDLSVKQPGRVHTKVADRVLVAGWGMAGMKRATYDAPGSPPVELEVVAFVSRTFYMGLVPTWSDDAVVTFYDATDHVIATYPR